MMTMTPIIESWNHGCGAWTYGDQAGAFSRTGGYGTCLSSLGLVRPIPLCSPRSEPEARSSSVRCLWACLMSDQEDPPSVIERGTAFVPGSSVVIVAGLDDDDLDDLRNVFVTTRPWNVFRESALITRGEAGF